MKIFLYAPFKPLSHPNPSGDLIIGRGLRDFLAGRGHAFLTPSSLRCRWIYWKPLQWFSLFREMRRAQRLAQRFAPDLWMTYHAYYKAPDMLGPCVCRCSGIPYVVFQGIYSTKRRRDIRTGPGFLLNRRALRYARHIFANRREDELNLRRIVPEDRLSYVPPGIYPEDFVFDPDAREKLRQSWNAGGSPVVLSAAMFRPDVKTEGLMFLIRACGKLYSNGMKLHLAIAGDGKERPRLEKLAREHLPGRTIFVGKIPRKWMQRFYSAGDIFAFPGIRESLGMVYLEAQSCGLPVVAFENGGIPEVVKDGETGFLTPFLSEGPFCEAISSLLRSSDLSKKMGNAAANYVRKYHDLNVNYRQVESTLEQLAERNMEKA